MNKEIDWIKIKKPLAEKILEGIEYNTGIQYYIQPYINKLQSKKDNKYDNICCVLTNMTSNNSNFKCFKHNINQNGCSSCKECICMRISMIGNLNYNELYKISPEDAKGLLDLIKTIITN